jgi:hypothetical protein
MIALTVLNALATNPGLTQVARPVSLPVTSPPTAAAIQPFQGAELFGGGGNPFALGTGFTGLTPSYESDIPHYARGFGGEMNQVGGKLCLCG